MRKTALSWLWVSVLVIVLDRISKYWIVKHVFFFEPWEILSVFNLSLAYNTGAAFSFLDKASGWQTILLLLLALVVAVVIIYWLYYLPKTERLKSIGLCCILGGALGNALDRFLYGYVIDFLDFHWQSWHFAIFNLADTSIFIGVCLLLWSLIKERQ